MNRTIYRVILLFTFSNIFSESNPSEIIDYKIYFISNLNGSIIREYPRLNSKEIDLIPYQFKIKIRDSIYPDKLVNNTEGNWIKIKVIDKTGWILESDFSTTNPNSNYKKMTSYEIGNICKKRKVDSCVEELESKVLSDPIVAKYAKRVKQTLILKHFEGNTYHVSDEIPEFRVGLSGYKYRLIDYIHKFNLFVVYGYYPYNSQTQIINSGRILLYNALGNFNLFSLEAHKSIYFSPSNDKICFSYVILDTCGDCQRKSFSIVHFNENSQDFQTEYYMNGDGNNMEFDDPIWINENKVSVKTNSTLYNIKRTNLKFKDMKWELEGN